MYFDCSSLHFVDWYINLCSYSFSHKTHFNCISSCNADKYEIKFNLRHKRLYGLFNFPYNKQIKIHLEEECSHLKLDLSS